MLEFRAGIANAVWWERGAGLQGCSPEFPHPLHIYNSFLVLRGASSLTALGASVGSQAELRSWDVLNLEKG